LLFNKRRFSKTKLAYLKYYHDQELSNAKVILNFDNINISSKMLTCALKA